MNAYGLRVIKKMMWEGSDTRDWFITLGTPFMLPLLMGSLIETLIGNRNTDTERVTILKYIIRLTQIDYTLSHCHKEKSIATNGFCSQGWKSQKILYFCPLILINLSLVTTWGNKRPQRLKGAHKFQALSIQRK